MQLSWLQRTHKQVCVCVCVWVSLVEYYHKNRKKHVFEVF